MNNFCPRCGRAARVLLNLVACITPNCRNYEYKFATEWSMQNTRHYTHHDNNHNFLGSTEIDNTIFDLYHAIVRNVGVCFVRMGNAQDQCYYIDDNQTEIGNLATGVVTKINKTLQQALKEALSRSPKAKK